MRGPPGTLFSCLESPLTVRFYPATSGLFAFALTLLMYDIHLPAIAGRHSKQLLQQALASLLPRLLTYALSFLTLGIFWVGHHTLLRYCARSNRNLT